jgi:hypothetical protein
MEARRSERGGGVQGLARESDEVHLGKWEDDWSEDTMM